MAAISSSQDIQKTAKKILELARRTLSQTVPALMPAFYALQEQAIELPKPLATDTVHLFYCPEQVVADFQADRRAVARQLLHLTLHCLLGHPAQRRNVKRQERFDLAADLKVHTLCLYLTEESPMGFLHLRDGSDEKRDPWSFLEAGLDFSRPPPVRGVAVDPNCPLPQLYCQMLKARSAKRLMVFHLDDHDFWYPAVRKKVSLLAGESKEDGGTALGSSGKSSSSSAGDPPAPNWDRLRLDLLSSNGEIGIGTVPDCLAAEFLPARENGISYESFLRRFLSIRERLLTDPDEVDFRWYTMGMELYGDIPLIEPPELSELPRTDDLVIAVDTSGSCSGAICRRFLRETQNLLQSIAARNAAFRVLLLQCDAAIQQEVLVNSVWELEDAMERFKPRGFGGTDFCPVFRRIEQLREEGVLKQVRGLLYLSDGWGDFPDQVPDYPTAFLLLQEPNLPKIPAWVTQVLLNPTDFTIQEASQ